MGLDGLHAEEQLGWRSPRWTGPGDEPQDLGLAVGEVRLGRAGGLPARHGAVASRPDGGGKSRDSPSSYRADRVHESSALGAVSGGIRRAPACSAS